LTPPSLRWRIRKISRADRVAQVVEHLPRKISYYLEIAIKIYVKEKIS
jgi:hypothetical protein